MKSTFASRFPSSQNVRYCRRILLENMTLTNSKFGGKKIATLGGFKIFHELSIFKIYGELIIFVISFSFFV